MPDVLRFHILAPPGRTVLQASHVRKVRVLLADGGWLSVYPGHAPLLAETLPGPVTYVVDEETVTIELAGGIVQVGQGEVTLFADDRVSPVDGDGVADGVAHEAATFDRLAQVLLVSLSAHTDGVLGEGPEQGGAL